MHGSVPVLANLPLYGCGESCCCSRAASLSVVRFAAHGGGRQLSLALRPSKGEGGASVEREEVVHGPGVWNDHDALKKAADLDGGCCCCCC